jgi:hypothetical protein
MLGHMCGWRISPEHFVERFGQVIIIALGESIVAIGVGAVGLRLDAGVIAAALLGMTVAACLWWSYFDWVVYVAEARLAEATGASRGFENTTVAEIAARRLQFVHRLPDELRQARRICLAGAVAVAVIATGVAVTVGAQT